MQFLQRLNIQTRLLILVVIPLMVTLVLSAERLTNAYQHQSDIKKLDTVLEYSDVAYPYIASLLEEAFYSRLYIDTNTNPFDDFSRQFRQVRRNALVHEQAYVRFIDANHDVLAKFNVLAGHINQINDFIDRLKLIRQGADERTHTLKHTAGDVHTMYEFTVVIRKLVLSISEVAAIAAQNEQLGKMSLSYYYLLAANMETSFHNSFVYAAMYNNLDVYIFGEILGGATKIQSYHELFNTFATERAHRAYGQLLKNTDFTLSDQIGLVARSNIYNTVNQPLKTDKNHQWADITANVLKAYEKAMSAVLTELLQVKDERIEISNNKVQQTWFIMAALFVLITLVSMFIARSITLPLQEFVQILSRIAHSKNIAVKLDDDGKDELAAVSRAFNDLLQSFNHTLLGFQQETTQINQSTKEMAESIHGASELLENQLLATDNISVAINEMTCTNEEVANLADRASTKIQGAHDLSLSGSNDAKNSREMMEKLTQELGYTSDVVNSLHEESNHIGNVLNVIQGIAEQTNLLALNAAIEAARAGEQGRGFAVVADEVRSLAGRTQESTEQIREQIETLQQQANAATTNMIALQKEGQRASDIVLHSAEAFEQITEELEQITEMAASIATASLQQTEVSNDINTRITAIRDDSHQITSSIQEVTASAQELKNTCHVLEQHIHEFELKI